MQHVASIALLHVFSFFIYITYLLNFGAIFPGGLGYIAPQKRFHVNSKRNHLDVMHPILKCKICITELKYLFKRIYFQL
jgi:hypothetical protein